MARQFTPRKQRSKSLKQKIIPHFFTPRSGISKDDIHFSVKPANKIGINSNLGFKETKSKQHYKPASDGSLYRINPPSGGSCSVKDLHQRTAEWRSPNRSPERQNERSFHNQTFAGSLKSQTEEHELRNFDPDPLHSVHFGDLYKQSAETRGPTMASSPSSFSSSSPAAGSTTSLTLSGKSKKRSRKSSSKKRSLRGGKPPKKKSCRVPSATSVDCSANEDSDEDCVIVNVVSGTPVNDSKLQEGVDRSSRNKSNSRRRKVSNEYKCELSSQSSSDRSSVQTNSRFGLFSDDVSESDSDLDDSDVSFASLPVELMENIFCQLPVVDLMLNCVLVCRSWHDVISSESFIPWKKKYFRLKRGVSACEDEMVDLLDREKLLELELFPLHLARFMNNFKGRRNVTLLQSLSQHSKFHLIASFLETLVTPGSDKESSPWSVVSLLTLVSQTVYEVQEIVRCLVKSNACLVQDILECFYCLASIFFLLETQHRIGSGLHYKVFYSLYLFENAFQATRASLSPMFDHNEAGQQSLTRYRSLTDRVQLTHEQVRIIKHDVKEGEVIKIVAFAGTGKTTTLIEYTKIRPMEKFLNVAYNKSIQEHAEKSFPCNVESRTVHSLAYRAVGYKYRHKLAPALRLSAIMDALPDKCGYLYARRVDDTLKNFIASTSSAVKARHVPPVNSTAVVISCETSDLVNSIFGNDGADLSFLNSEKHVEKVVLHAQLLWERMIDLGDMGIPITHDGYLKIYQLSRPVLTGYHCLLIDEAQDCTPAAADVLLKQRCAKILVGDPHQQIYAFRGAKNALREVAGTHTFYLTQSFRFGPEIAYVAACVLDVLKGVRNKTLVGGAKPGSVLGDREGQLCIITRCNYTLFNEAVRVCCSQNSTRVAFVGGIRGLALDRVLDIHKLFTAGTNNGNLGIKDNLIRKFRSFDNLKRFAKAASDFELLGKMKIVEGHHVMLEQRIEKIKSKTCHDIKQADIVFSTAHKAKGLEFDTVRLTDDFLAGTEVGISHYDHNEDEKNLVYVAVSRAKRCLQLTSTVLRILEVKKEHFLKVLSFKETFQDKVPPVCSSCMDATDVSPRPPQVVVQKEVVNLGGLLRTSGGILGPSCALKKMPHLGCLVNPTLVQVNQSESESESE